MSDHPKDVPFEFQADLAAAAAENNLSDKTVFTGLYFAGDPRSIPFMQLKMPCGTEVSYTLPEIPLVDTPCPCGNPLHWIVRVGEADATPN